jgi:hypothetical protein
MAPMTGVWRVIGASVTGTAHTRAGTPCQDAHRWEMLPDGCLIAAVADGAGSAPRAEEGSRLAADTAVAHLAASVRADMPADTCGWHDAMRAAFEAATASLAAIAADAETAVRDYATTLTLVAATPDMLAVGQIGDGIVVAEDRDGALFLAATPQRGEYANEVALLTAPDAAARMILSCFSTGVRAFAATTDGLLRLAVRLPAYEPHAPFFRPLFAFAMESTDSAAAAEPLAAFLASERVTRRTDDDKTLVLAVYVEAPDSELAASAPMPDAPPDG